MIGPGGTQTVPLSNQAMTSLRMSVARTVVSGHLTMAGGAGIAGQLVTLYKRVSGRTSAVSSARTRAGGSVNFRVSPQGATSYSLAFAGSPTLAAVNSAPARAPGSRRSRRRH